MKPRIALIGAQDSMELIEEVIEEYRDKAIFYKYPYNDKVEIIEYIEEVMSKVDLFIFSGIVPYTYARKNINISKLNFYIPHEGTCIYKNLWQIKQTNLPLNDISFDLIKEKVIKEILAELEIKDCNFYTYPYRNDIEYDRLADFHHKLWKEGKTKIAVTSLYSTYKSLKRAGMTVFRITLTKSLIRQTLDYAIYEENVKRLKANQIGAIFIDIDNFSKVIKKFPSEYEIQRIKMKLHELILDYGQITQGSVFSIGSDDFFVFTTRGSIEISQGDNSILTLMENIKNKLGISISCGLGFGKTSYGAELNAKLGMHHAKEAGGDCLFIVTDEGTIKGPIARTDSISFKYMNHSKNLVELSSKTGLSASQISKIQSVIKKAGNMMNSRDLAIYLKVTERSARRILSKLLETGCAEIVGQESPKNVGRPRKTYRVRL